jgi:hypothetical protein
MDGSRYDPRILHAYRSKRVVAVGSACCLGHYTCIRMHEVLGMVTRNSSVLRLVSLPSCIAVGTMCRSSQHGLLPSIFSHHQVNKMAEVSASVCQTLGSKISIWAPGGAPPGAVGAAAIESTLYQTTAAGWLR